MLRRVHTPQLRPGTIALDATQSRHVRDVLRLPVGSRIEVFDDKGATAMAVLLDLKPVATVQVTSMCLPGQQGMDLAIASAIPKGERADWMIEKLSELGVSRFVPLKSERSVVLPEGRNKLARWQRLARESAKQSRRRGVMEIEAMTTVGAVLRAAPTLLFLSTDPSAASILKAVSSLPAGAPLMLLIGPEGGWSDDELAQFADSKLIGVKLTDTVLRVETAAIAAASVVVSMASNSARDS